MKEITIIYGLPIVLTKDRDFLELQKIHQTKMVPGSVILIPEDAVLVVPPEIMEAPPVEIHVPKKPTL